MKKVLVISYYWPPAGGVEVHRVVKFCKYLPAFGYEPLILTVQNSTAAVTDPGLVHETDHIQTVRTAPAIEPHRMYAAVSANHENATRTFGEFVRLNLFIPDARIGWKPAAVREGDAIINEMKPDLMFSTAPPYTVHLIAKTLAKRHGIPWVADFRDPWVENYAYNTGFRFPWVLARNERLERSVLDTADRVIVATDGQLTLQSGKAKNPDKFCTITNGHDLDGMPEPTAVDHFHFSYFGSLSTQRVPIELFNLLGDLIRESTGFAKEFRFRFAGRITSDARRLIEDRLPTENCEFLPMLSHQEYLKRVREQQVLLILIDQVANNSLILPAKCFEMATTGNPLFACGPAGGDTDQFLRQHERGQLFDYQDRNGMRASIQTLYQRWKDGSLNTGARLEPDLHRKALTRQLARQFDSLGTD